MEIPKGLFDVINPKILLKRNGKKLSRFLCGLEELISQVINRKLTPPVSSKLLEEMDDESLSRSIKLSLSLSTVDMRFCSVVLAIG